MTIRHTDDQQIAYVVHWQSGLVTATDPEHMGFTGTFKGVSGILCRGGKPSVGFSADQGTADNVRKVLTLQGSVHVSALASNPLVKGATVRCGRMDYASSDEIIKASGDVTVQGPQFELGPLDEAWCANDLSEIAAPSEYVRVRHNQRAKAPK